jgi:hypothetical protein
MGNAGRPMKRGFFKVIAEFFVFDKRDMKKNVSVSVCKMFLAVILCAWIFLSAGCSARQLGEMTAQGHRRHERVLRINQQEMNADIDKTLLLEKPSGLTEKRVP